MEKTIKNFSVTVEVTEEDGVFAIATTKKTESIIEQPIYISAKSLVDGKRKFWAMLKIINNYNKERSEELDKWKFFQKGDWKHVGGSWFIIFGINVYFRRGKGMKGGWYVPFTNLNIRICNLWKK